MSNEKLLIKASKIIKEELRKTHIYVDVKFIIEDSFDDSKPICLEIVVVTKKYVDIGGKYSNAIDCNSLKVGLKKIIKGVNNFYAVNIII